LHDFDPTTRSVFGCFEGEATGDLDSHGLQIANSSPVVTGERPSVSPGESDSRLRGEALASAGDLLRPGHSFYCPVYRRLGNGSVGDLI
jgi:hypothetical protein